MASLNSQPGEPVQGSTLSGIRNKFAQQRQPPPEVKSEQAIVVRVQEQFRADEAIRSGDVSQITNPSILAEAVNKIEANKQRSNIRARESMLKQSLNALDQVIVTAINFSILSDEDLEREGVVEVKNANKSGAGSLYDVKMGAIRSDSTCATCHMNDSHCRGHMGYIRLETLIYHPELIQIIIYTLMSICHSCSRLLVDIKWMKQNKLFDLHGTARLKALATKIGRRACIYGEREGQKCFPNPASYDMAVSKSTGRIMIYMGTGQSKESKPTALDINRVKTIVSNISNSDVELMGFNVKRGSHPKNLIRRLWPVMSSCARSPVVTATGTQWDKIDDQYKLILELNDQLRLIANNTDPDSIIEKETLTSQLYVLIGEIATGQTNKENRNTFMSLKDYMEKKSGIPRKDIMSSKQPLSLRLVITPDPNMGIGELSVPQYATRILTREVKVTSQNKHQIEEWQKQDIIEFVESGKTGVLKHYRVDKVKPQIQPGDTVIRQAIDGDYVMFVRQPVLLKIGFMGYRIRVCRDARSMTFRFNLANTGPHHADFDGDEMTAFSIMSDQVKFLAGATENIISSITGRPIYELTYNALTSMYMLTSEERIFSYPQFFQLLQGTTTIKDQPIIPPPNAAAPPKIHFNDQLPPQQGFITVYGQPKRNDPELSQYWAEYDSWQHWRKPGLGGADLDADNEQVQQWLDGNTLLARAYKLGVRNLTSNKMLFSAILPEKLNYYYKGVAIKNGILLSGVINEDHLAGGAQTITQLIFDLYQQSGLLEKQRTIRFLDDAYILGDNYISWRGLSLGISSVIAKPAKKEPTPEPNAALVQVIRDIDRRRAEVIAAANNESDISKYQFKPDQPIKVYGEIRLNMIDVMKKYVQLNNSAKFRLAYQEFVSVLPHLDPKFNQWDQELRPLLTTLWPVDGPQPPRVGPIERGILAILNKIINELVELDKDKTLVNMRQNELEKLQSQLEELGGPSNDQLQEDIRQERKTLTIQGYSGRTQKLFKSGQIKMNTPELEMMINSGSKGNIGSLSQMSFTGYQQFLSGKIYSPNVDIPGRNYNMARSNPWAPLGATDAETRELNDRLEYEGFVRSPFIQGLSLSEAMSTAPPARESAINTNLDVSRTGYQQRKLATTAMDSIVSSDNTVRKVTTESEVPSIVSWHYGDGFRVDKTLLVRVGNNLVKSIIDLDSWTAEYNRSRGWDGTEQ